MFSVRLKRLKLRKLKRRQSEREKFDPSRNPATDLQAAIATAQAENKRIILDVGGEWCGWCRLMDNYLIQNKELGKLKDENYVWVKVNMSEENENAGISRKVSENKRLPASFRSGKRRHASKIQRNFRTRRRKIL